MASVIRCVDRRHRIVELPASNWRDKILLDHFELAGNELSIALTVEDPDVHTRDKRYHDRENFYRRGALPPPNDGDYLKVVVGYTAWTDGTIIGRVITAYAIEQIPRGETRIWTRLPRRADRDR